MAYNNTPFKKSFKDNQCYKTKHNKIVIDFTTNPQKSIRNILMKSNHNCQCSYYFKTVLQIFFDKLHKLRTQRDFFKQKIKEMQRQILQKQTLKKQNEYVYRIEQSFPLVKIINPDKSHISAIQEAISGSFLSDKEIYRIEQSKIDSSRNLYEKILQNQCQKQLKYIEQKYNLTDSELKQILLNIKSDKEKTSAGSEPRQSLKLDENMLVFQNIDHRIL